LAEVFDLGNELDEINPNIMLENMNQNFGVMGLTSLLISIILIKQF
jgi:hypothetical protein